MRLKPTLSIWISVLSLTTLLLAGCGQGDGQQGQKPVQKVEVVTIKAQPYMMTTDLPGRTSAYRVAEVRPQVDGIILKRFFTEGSEVKEGDQLYQIDPAIYQADVQRTQANVVAAQALEKRYRSLVATKAVSQQQYDDAKAALLQAQADLKTAQVRLRYTKVLAPITGRIGRSLVTEGALVTAGQASPLASINQLNPIYVDITQPSKDILALREQIDNEQSNKSGETTAKVQLLLENDRVYEHEGELKFSEVSVNESTGSVTLRAVFENPDDKLLPGMFVQARLEQGVRQNAILVPQLGVTRNVQGEAVAMVVDKDNKVEHKILDVSRVANRNQWLVNKGLAEGDRVIVTGLQKIQVGMVVDPVEKGQNNQQEANKVSTKGGEQTAAGSGK